MTFQFLLSTPDKTYFNGPADSLVVPGLGGYFGVLAKHACMVAAIGTGIAKVQSAGVTKLFVIDGGVAEVTPDETVILADLAISATDIADAEQKLEELKVKRVVPVSF